MRLAIGDKILVPDLCHPRPISGVTEGVSLEARRAQESASRSRLRSAPRVLQRTPGIVDQHSRARSRGTCPHHPERTQKCPESTTGAACINRRAVLLAHQMLHVPAPGLPRILLIPSTSRPPVLTATAPAHREAGSLYRLPHRRNEPRCGAHRPVASSRSARSATRRDVRRNRMLPRSHQLSHAHSSPVRSVPRDLRPRASPQPLVPSKSLGSPATD